MGVAGGWKEGLREGWRQVIGFSGCEKGGIGNDKKENVSIPEIMLKVDEEEQ